MVRETEYYNNFLQIYFMSRQIEKTTEDKMYLHIGCRLPLKCQEMNYPN